MTTINIYFNNGQWLTFSAEGNTTINAAINEARKSMPTGADKFRIATRNGATSPWMR